MTFSLQGRRAFLGRCWRYAPVMALASALLTILYLALTPASSVPFTLMWDKLNHGLAFFVLALLLDLSRPRQALALGDWSLLLGYGLLIEVVQGFLPTREFSWLDLLADAVGIMLYVTLSRLGINIRRWYRRLGPEEPSK